MSQAGRTDLTLVACQAITEPRSYLHRVHLFNTPPL